VRRPNPRHISHHLIEQNRRGDPQAGGERLAEWVDLSAEPPRQWSAGTPVEPMLALNFHKQSTTRGRRNSGRSATTLLNVKPHSHPAQEKGSSCSVEPKSAVNLHLVSLRTSVPAAE
jgi:hypothetical protein